MNALGFATSLLSSAVTFNSRTSPVLSYEMKDNDKKENLVFKSQQ